MVAPNQSPSTRLLVLDRKKKIATLLLLAIYSQSTVSYCIQLLTCPAPEDHWDTMLYRVQPLHVPEEEMEGENLPDEA